MTGLAFPDISPIAFTLFGLDVRWYSLAYLSGFLLALFYMKKLVKTSPHVTSPSHKQIEDFISVAVIGVILGGRLGYVFFYHPSYFLSNPDEIFAVWKGGMSFHGGALGVIFALYFYSIYQKISFLRLADLVCASVPIGLFFGRLANFANGELYGRSSDMSWAIRFPQGGGIARHPSQLYEAALEGALLFVLLYLSYKKFHDKPGITSGFFLAGYGLFRFIVEYFREPDPAYGLILNVVSIGQLLSLPMILIGSAIALYFFNRK